MKLTVVSAFRDSAKSIPSYFDKINRLQAECNLKGHDLSLVLGYGDSTDDTCGMLHEECAHRFDAYLVDVSHGGPKYGSIVHPDRFRQLARVGNLMWQNIPQTTDIVCLVESDLIWGSKTILDLMQSLLIVEESLMHDIVIAPMVHHLDGRFYDTWAFRRRGVNFTNEKPYHKELSSYRYIDMDSVGSVVMMRYGLAQRLHWPEEDVVVGLCRLAKKLGALIILDTQQRVYHP